MPCVWLLKERVVYRRRQWLVNKRILQFFVPLSKIQLISMQVAQVPLFEIKFWLSFSFPLLTHWHWAFLWLVAGFFSVSNLFFSTPFWHLDSSCAKSDFTVTGRQLLDVLHLINFAPNYKQCWPITKGINILVPWLSHHGNGCLSKSSKSNYHIVCTAKCEAECRKRDELEFSL